MAQHTKTVYIGKVPVGGGNPITVQSMTNTKTSETKATVKQILELERGGCDIVRVAVPDEYAARSLPEIKKEVSVPVVADIHFDYRLALLVVEMGADSLRINPGNIGSLDRLEQVVKAAKRKGIPIRIGVNAGSLERDILERYKTPSADAMVESALRNVITLERLGFYDIKISLKSSDVKTTIRAYRTIADKTEYPLHLGVTEAGTFVSGTVKSAVGIGSLLAEGVGDTIRVSLTDHPLREVEVGKEILRCLGLCKKGVEIVSCPTCGRCEVDIIELAKRVKDAARDIHKPIKIAIMGCAVNGPGEAREADIGIAGGKGKGIIFKNGKIIKRVEEQKLLDALLEEIDKY